MATDDHVCAGLFASRLAPTGERIPIVGASRRESARSITAIQSWLALAHRLGRALARFEQVIQHAFLAVIMSPSLPSRDDQHGLTSPPRWFLSVRT